jgi:hypothetical protein
MKMDLQDALLVLGIALLLGGIGAWSLPAACIVGGLMCLLGVFLIQIGQAQRPKAERGR